MGKNKSRQQRKACAKEQLECPVCYETIACRPVKREHNECFSCKAVTCETCAKEILRYCANTESVDYKCPMCRHNNPVFVIKETKDGKVAYESILIRKEPLLAIRGCCEEVELVTLKHNSRGMYETKSLIVNDIRAVRHPNAWDDVTVRRSDWDEDTSSSEDEDTVFNRIVNRVIASLEPEPGPERYSDLWNAIQNIMRAFNIYHYGSDKSSK